MNWREWTSRKLVIRSYLVLAGGLMLTALSLDLLFSRTQAQGHDGDQAWVDSTFALVESRLGSVAPDQREAELGRLRQLTGQKISLLEDAPSDGPSLENAQSLLNSRDERLFLKWSPALGVAIRIGPMAEPAPHTLSRLLPMFFYASILLIVGLWLSPLLRDMNRLTEASQRFAKDYREPLQTAKHTTHLQPLAHNLDEMSARLSQLIQSQKELTAALSHEMRTPLARIRFALAVMGNEASARVRGQLQDINQDVTQIDRIVASLLEHARLDHPDLRMDWQEVVLGDWLPHVLDKSSLPDREVALDVADPSLTVAMDPRLMELAVGNLVSNACRHAQRRVRISVERDAERIRLCVEDDGPGIPEEERTSVFRAFKTLDRVREGRTGGFGLGLAIVARVAALHGGTVEAAGSPILGGALLRLEWPREAV